MFRKGGFTGRERCGIVGFFRVRAFASGRYVGDTPAKRRLCDKTERTVCPEAQAALPGNRVLETQASKATVRGTLRTGAGGGRARGFGGQRPSELWAWRQDNWWSWMRHRAKMSHLEKTGSGNGQEHLDQQPGRMRRTKHVPLTGAHQATGEQLQRLCSRKGISLHPLKILRDPEESRSLRDSIFAGRGN